MMFRNIDRRMSLNATGPARFVSTSFRLPCLCRFCYKLFSRGWVTLPKSWVSRAISFRLLACRHRRFGRNRSSRRIIARLRKFRWCSSCDYPSEHSGLRATHLYHRSAVCRAVPMVLFPGAAALRFPFRPSQNLNLQRRCLF